MIDVLVTCDDRSGDTDAAPLFTATLPQIFRLAAGGRGACELAASTYGSSDWHLVRTAFHESGHGCIASGFGEAASIEILTPSTGKCWHWLPEGGGRSPEAQRMISLAGPVAEELATYGLWCSDKRIAASITPARLSTADRVHAGDYSAADLARCADMVRSAWPWISEIAARVTNQYTAAWSAA